MRVEYDGVKFYSDSDMSLSYYFDKGSKILDRYEKNTQYTDINQIIELYNIYEIFTSKNIKTEYTIPYNKKVIQLMPVVACYFKDISDKSFLKQYYAVSMIYIDDFWELFDKFKVYENVSDDAFKDVINDPETALYIILKYKGIVQHYDTTLAECMRQSDQTAEIIIDKFLRRNDSTSETSCYIPSALKATEFEEILNKYIDAEYPHVGMLQLLASSQSSAECPISDELRLKAKRKAEIYWKEHSGNGFEMTYGVGVMFIDSDQLISMEVSKPNQYQFIYDANWIRENQDYPTLLNNFIYLFGYTDLHFRCTFPSIRSQLGIFERTLGIKGRKEYETGSAFRISDMKSSIEMKGYMEFISEFNIHIEDIYKWFFMEYLKDEFGVCGFIFNPPSYEQSFLEKCRNLPSEMDGILKQYQLFVQYGEIDRELLEMSSNPVRFNALPSMTNNKYVYVNSAEIEREQFLLFSDQSMLHYLPNIKKTFKNFFEILYSWEVKITDYPEYKMNDLRWLEKRGTIRIDVNGKIHGIDSRVRLLKDLYTHDVVCMTYYKDKSEIEKLVLSGELRYGNTLFSIPEQNYLNYMLNKSEYSNGKDLRNRYIHSTYPIDVRQQEQDYMIMLKIMAVIIIKINEEFCLQYPTNS